jgi:hypothetical protein
MMVIMFGRASYTSSWCKRLGLINGLADVNQKSSSRFMVDRGRKAL